jgi:DNA-binding NarL/FixJ family response regulator
LKAISPDARVILSSGYNEVEAVQRFSGKGLAGFIQKPYSSAVLVAKVEAFLPGGKYGTAGSSRSEKDSPAK